MRRITSKLSALAAVALLAFTTTSAARADDQGNATHVEVAPAYFKMQDIRHDSFVIKLTDPVRIADAREIVRSGSRKIVIGRIVKSRADYNAQWSYHYNPDSVTFADAAMEVCDSTISFTEGHLDQAGGGPFLPGLYWCPWTGRLTEEVAGR
ncbi:calmodulin-binding protein [Streptomyces sp. NBC_01387]|uniref:BP74-related protein n=1 Tax=unclassified Streptomyces TaxID=2593676 RepID=UPI00202540D9|nr:MULTISPECIES: calmodulin-binding protein [unclassified Streptomyces]MCX4549082.1 calmodulin-binding protein [Streptomyces sp. NBC_01500]WSC20659.1 calmodulin-binding protein [Streptomyces sp. NBC_01766]WSV54688.1 calmodulin-binding protein [Streptomyces sp. NBC_01014]